MKKFLLIGLIVGVVLLVVGGAGIVYAHVRGLDNTPTVAVKVTQNQNGNTIVRQFGYGNRGMMDNYGWGNGPNGMMGGRGWNETRGMGTMRTYIITAFAKAVGLTADQVNTRLAKGETLNQIAIAQGTKQADLPALVTKVYKAALDQAVSDGVITQAQEDRALKNLNNTSVQGFGKSYGSNKRPMRNNWNGRMVPIP